MKRTKPDPPEPNDFRERAERALLRQSGKRPVVSPQDLRKLVGEVEVHQIELEMQNDELRRSHSELQAVRDRYAELYDFSPAGHLTLDRKGVIQEANLQAGILLGIPRQKLLRRSLIAFITPSEQSAFARHFLDVYRTGVRQSCELTLQSCAESAPVILHLECQAYPNETGTME